VRESREEERGMREEKRMRGKEGVSLLPLLASVFPARRAAAADPLASLRVE
jgi:hypothetical protein